MPGKLIFLPDFTATTQEKKRKLMYDGCFSSRIFESLGYHHLRKKNQARKRHIVVTPGKVGREGKLLTLERMLKAPQRHRAR